MYNLSVTNSSSLYKLASSSNALFSLLVYILHGRSEDCNMWVLWVSIACGWCRWASGIHFLTRPSLSPNEMIIWLSLSRGSYKNQEVCGNRVSNTRAGGGGGNGRRRRDGNGVSYKRLFFTVAVTGIAVLMGSLFFQRKPLRGRDK